MTEPKFGSKIDLAMGNASRLVRQIQVMLLISIALYVAAGEIVARRQSREPSDTLFHALSFVSISVVGATLVVRRTLVMPSETILQERPNDALAIEHWKTAYLFLYSLCDVLGLFGLILRISGFALGTVWGFYLGGFLLLLLYSPRAAYGN